MKIKFKTYTTSVYTSHSPYFYENGRHIQKDVIACCGNCERSVEEARFYKSWNYCPYCGEKIDWEEDK